MYLAYTNIDVKVFFPADFSVFLKKEANKMAGKTSVVVIVVNFRSTVYCIVFYIANSSKMAQKAIYLLPASDCLCLEVGYHAPN